MNVSKTKKPLFVRCMLFLTIGVMLSFITVTALAANVDMVEGPKKIFQLGSGNYRNYAILTYSHSSMVATPSTHIDCTSGTCPAGHLGALADIYKEISADTYTLYSAGSWYYSTSEVSGVGNAANTVKNIPKGNYMCKGQTAVYYSGAYRRQDTYSTPLLSIIP